MSESRIIIGDGKVSKTIRKPGDIVVPHKKCDITVLADVMDTLKGFTGTVINCAAKTNLEWCSKNRDESYLVNTVGPINILRACQAYGCKLVHISTGCVFDGSEAPVLESDHTSPAVWYTKTKDWADSYIQSYGYENYLILRPRQMISSKEHSTNMITKFLSHETLYCHKESNSITCTEDFSLMIEHLLKIDARGVYNCVNAGVVSPFEIAQMVKKHLRPRMNVVQITYDEMLDMIPEKRVNAVLSVEKLKSTGFSPRSASDALTWCLENYE